MRLKKGDTVKQFFMRGLCLALWCAAAHAEFLIVKKIQDKDGKEIFAPLDFEDKSDNAAAPIITQILLKYEWPMCTAADLTEAEMAELLAPDVPQAEENFIQKKLDSALKNIGRYSIVFIPTSLYELLCMQCYFENEKSLDPLGKRIRISAGDALTRKYEYKNPGETHKKFFKDAAALKKEILGIFIAQNEQAFGIVPMKSNPFFIANNYVLKNIFTTVDLATSSDVEVLVTTIQKKMDDIIKSAVLLADHTRALENIGLNSETKNRIIPKVVALEYEARMVNKGLLFRGAYFTAIESATFLSEKLPVLGMPFISSAGKYETINALLKDVTPYSVSYGTSLFAGTVYDADACAYGYLSGTQAWKHSQGGATGYALFINKKEYMESQNNNLFFIPPLAPLISLFASGEYFHARAKVSISKKTKELLVIQGLCEAIIEDPFGFLVVTRDPFKHAQLFSNFLAKNGRIIQTGDSSSLAEEEKNFVEQVMKNQAQTTRLLKDMRTAVPPVRKALRKRVEQNAAKKAEVEKKREAQQAEQAEAERKKDGAFDCRHSAGRFSFSKKIDQIRI